MKKIIAVLILSLFVVSILAACGNSQEKKAQALYDAGEYLAAAEIFAELGNKRMQAESLYEAGKYSDAYEIFNEINDLSGASKCLTAMRGILG